MCRVSGVPLADSKHGVPEPEAVYRCSWGNSWGVILVGVLAILLPVLFAGLTSPFAWQAFAGYGAGLLVGALVIRFGLLNRRVRLRLESDRLEYLDARGNVHAGQLGSISELRLCRASNQAESIDVRMANEQFRISQLSPDDLESVFDHFRKLGRFEECKASTNWKGRLRSAFFGEQRHYFGLRCVATGNPALS